MRKSSLEYRQLSGKMVDEKHHKRVGESPRKPFLPLIILLVRRRLLYTYRDKFNYNLDRGVALDRVKPSFYRACKEDEKEREKENEKERGGRR